VEGKAVRGCSAVRAGVQGGVAKRSEILPVVALAFLPSSVVAVSRSTVLMFCSPIACLLGRVISGSYQQKNALPFLHSRLSAKEVTGIRLQVMTKKTRRTRRQTQSRHYFVMVLQKDRLFFLFTVRVADYS
jgi:hypothetical protein